jgi:hypothetical protein
MPEEVEADLTDADMSHFCNGDPVYCYYFRVPSPGGHPSSLPDPVGAVDLPEVMSLLAGMLDDPSLTPGRSLPSNRHLDHETT